jgi:hypothetical protein
MQPIRNINNDSRALKDLKLEHDVSIMVTQVRILAQSLQKQNVFAIADIYV